MALPIDTAECQEMANRAYDPSYAPVCAELSENVKFIARDYPQNMNILVKTSCILTAAIMRFRVAENRQWIPVIQDYTLFAKHTTIQFKFYAVAVDYQAVLPDGTIVENHILTVHNGYIIQSFFGCYGWMKTPLTLAHRIILSKSHISDSEISFLDNITEASPIARCHCYPLGFTVRAEIPPQY